jgi:xanthine dehydrogenase YagR molybdenum-binding subunit
MPDLTLTTAPAHLRHGSSIGQPLTRRDGVLKVTGEARYAADNHPPKMLHAVKPSAPSRAAASASSTSTLPRNIPVWSR